jgi:large subunit ribosomal protein L21
MLRVDKIELDPFASAQTLKQPKKLLELWANRWLSLREVAAVEKQKPTEQISVSEHQPGSFQRRGLVDAYRFTPDPLAPKVKYF